MLGNISQTFIQHVCYVVTLYSGIMGIHQAKNVLARLVNMPTHSLSLLLLPVWTVPIWKNVRINSCSAD